MRFTQHNPVPLPSSGAREAVPSSFDTVFDWEYRLADERLLALYEKGKAAAWNADDLAWDTPVDLEQTLLSRPDPDGDAFHALMKPPRRLDRHERVAMNVNMNAWMLSQFLHGEQGALLATAKIVQGAPDEEAKFYAANQVSDEARHVEVYHRYLTEKLGTSFEVNRDLQTLLDEITRDSRWDMTYLGMQIMVEGLALAAFGLIKLEMADEPLIQDITHRIMGDESRHVAFGVLALEDVYRDMTESELREREEFVIEASVLMHDRLLMRQVFERLDWEVDVWVDWARNTAFMRGFRQMLFSKIVPNLKRLGLLTPRVREVYDGLGLLRFEHLKDSSEDPDALAPAELIQLLTQLRAEVPDQP